MNRRKRKIKMRKEKIRLDVEPTMEQKLEAILTSGKTVGEILAELQKLMPQFDFEEVK